MVYKSYQKCQKQKQYANVVKLRREKEFIETENRGNGESVKRAQRAQQAKPAQPAQPTNGNRNDSKENP